MSRVALKAVAYYEMSEDGYSPVDSCIPVRGVEEFFTDIAFPKKGKTFLYGHRNPALMHLLKYTPRGMGSEILTVEAEIGEWLRQKADLQESSEFYVGKTGFLSLARSKRDIVDLCDKIMVDAKGGEWAGSDGWPKKGTRYPLILDTLIEREEFKHLKVISYSVFDLVIGDFQVATVFDDSAYINVEAGAHFDGVQFVF